MTRLVPQATKADRGFVLLLALLSAAYQLGYRAALLLTDAWLLVIAANYGWPLSYQLIAALMGVGIVLNPQKR